MPRVENTVMIKDARLIFRNFKGEEKKYNRAGQRNFGAIIPDRENALAMMEDGWNIKWLAPRAEDEEGTEATPWLPIEVDFLRYRPPHVVLITAKGREDLHDDTIAQLDNVQIINVDLIVRPYNWDDNGTNRVKAYLQTMFVTIEQDELEMEYERMFKEREQQQ